MGVVGGPNIVEDDLVLYYDIINQKTFPFGEPTFNYSKRPFNLTGNGYADSNEYYASTFSKIYYPDHPSPVGNGATLITEQPSTTNAYRALSRWGGGSEERNHSLSAYIYPVSGITTMRIGLLGDSGNMITFSFTNKTVTYGSGIFYKNAFIEEVDGWPGWYRIGGNIDGRFGGWVGSMGIVTASQYITSEPYKSFYITGVQYERKIAVTPFTTYGSRNILYDVSSNKINGTLFNYGSFYNNFRDANNGIIFDGTNDYLNFTLNNTSGDWVHSIELVFKLNSDQSSISSRVDPFTFGNSSDSQYSALDINNGNINWYFYNNDTRISQNLFLSDTFYHVTLTYSGGGATIANKKMYVNGANIPFTSQTGTSAGQLLNLPSNAVGSLGRDRGRDTAYFPGKIYSFKIYNKVLNPREVLDNYNATKGRFGL